MRKIDIDHEIVSSKVHMFIEFAIIAIIGTSAHR